MLASIGSKFSLGNVRRYLSSSNGRAELVVLGFVVVYVLVTSYYTVSKDSLLASKFTGYGYYSLVIGVVIQLVTLIRLSILCDGPERAY